MSDDLEINDSRIEFMANYCLNTLCLKVEKWIRMYDFQESRRSITQFLENPEQDTICFYEKSVGNLVASNTFPHYYKRKACYLIKNSKIAISKEQKMNNLVTFGDILPMPIEQFSVILDEVE